MKVILLKVALLYIALQEILNLPVLFGGIPSKIEAVVFVPSQVRNIYRLVGRCDGRKVIHVTT